MRTPTSKFEPFFPGLKKEDLPDGEGWAVETVTLSTHNGTHLDAPFHFHSTMDKALGQAKTRHHHRRGSAGVVLSARGQTSISGTCPTAMW